MKFDLIILAAGKGVRMNLPYSKLIADINGRPLIYYTVREALKAEPSTIIAVTNVDNNDVENALGDFGNSIKFVKQKKLLGTADAVIMGLTLSQSEYVVVINGDMPLITSDAIKKLFDHLPTDETVIYTKSDDAGSLGRIIFTKDNFEIVEAADLNGRLSKYVNSGIYIFKRSFLDKNLGELTSDNNKHELYITDLFNRKAAKNALFYKNWKDLSGVNNIYELKFAAEILKRRKINALMEKGVIIHGDSYIEEDVKIEAPAVIYPYVVLKGKTKIGSGCTVESFSTIKNSVIADNVVIKSGSYIEDSSVGEKSLIGPMAHLRPGSVIKRECKVGNFVETKKATFEPNVKASHLSYIGDCDVGEGTNIGCGTITCNYDGFNKFKTIIGKNVFIGSDSQLVAPVKIGNGALVAAGSTIVEDVPENAMAISRTTQKNIKNAAKRFRNKRES